MGIGALEAEKYFNARFSFKPLIERWKQKMKEGRKGNSLVYKDILAQVLKYPELLEPMDDLSIVEKHPALMEIIMSTIFPATFDDAKQLYAVSLPFSYKFAYSSTFFKQAFLDEQGNLKISAGDLQEDLIKVDKLESAYRLIFSKLYGFPFNGSMNSLQRYTDKESGLTCYLELRVDPQFIDVVSKMKLPDASVFENYREYGEILQIPNIREILPVENFVFEGMAVIYIEDVTERESIAAIKNKLLSIHSLADATVFEYLQTQMQ
ncbi:MAG: hypothetical protein H7Y27_12935, partial [Gemmatimonadaceae bacterium]|nr:hypothetical protein [Chitinophagaceae bacterium]